MSAINVTSVQVLVRVFPRSPLLVDRRADPDPPRGPSTQTSSNLARPVTLAHLADRGVPSPPTAAHLARRITPSSS